MKEEKKSIKKTERYTESYRIEKSRIISQVATACLALTSFYTTKKGFDTFIFKENPIMSTVVSFAIQSLLLVISLNLARIIEAFKQKGFKVKVGFVCFLFIASILFSSGFSYVFFSNYMYIETWNGTDKRHIILECMRNGSYEMMNNLAVISNEFNLEDKYNVSYNAFCDGLYNDIYDYLNNEYNHYKERFSSNAEDAGAVSAYAREYNNFMTDFENILLNIQGDIVGSDRTIDKLYNYLTRIGGEGDIGILNSLQNRLNMDIRMTDTRNSFYGDVNDRNLDLRKWITSKENEISDIRNAFDSLYLLQLNPEEISEEDILNINTTLNQYSELLNGPNRGSSNNLIKILGIYSNIKELEKEFDAFISKLNDGFNNMNAIKKYDDSSDSEPADIDGIDTQNFEEMRMAYMPQDEIIRNYLNAFTDLINSYKQLINEYKNSDTDISDNINKVIKAGEAKADSLNKKSSKYSRRMLTMLNPIVDSIYYMRYHKSPLPFIAAGLALFLDLSGVLVGLLLSIFRKIKEVIGKKQQKTTQTTYDDQTAVEV